MFKKGYLLYVIFTIYFGVSAQNVLAAETIKNISLKMEEMSNEDFGYKKKEISSTLTPYKTILKHYKPYKVTITNKEKQTLLLSSFSEFEINKEVTLANTEETYKKIRKKDMGRYYSISLPCAAIGGFITGASFFILAPVGIGIAVAGMVPFYKAVDYNSKMARSVFLDSNVPLRLEPGQSHTFYLLIPKNVDAKSLSISNISYDLKNMYSIEAEISEAL